MKSRDLGYLEEIREYGRRALGYTSGYDADSFAATTGVQDQVIRCLTVIGEAAKQVTEESRERLATLDWRAMMRLRDLLVHQYRRIDLGEVWRIVERDLPPLVQELDSFLSEFK